MKTIGNRIREMRLERGIKTQEALASLVGLTQSQISEIETKGRIVSAEKLIAFSRALQVSPFYLVEGINRDDDMETIELLRLFKMLDATEKEMLGRVIHGLVASKSNKIAA